MNKIEKAIELMYKRLSGLYKMEVAVHSSYEESYIIRGQIYELKLCINIFEEILREG